MWRKNKTHWQTSLWQKRKKNFSLWESTKETTSLRGQTLSKLFFVKRKSCFMSQISQRDPRQRRQRQRIRRWVNFAELPRQTQTAWASGPKRPKGSLSAGSSAGHAGLCKLHAQCLERQKTMGSKLVHKLSTPVPFFAHDLACFSSCLSFRSISDKDVGWWCLSWGKPSERHFSDGQPCELAWQEMGWPMRRNQKTKQKNPERMTFCATRAEYRTPCSDSVGKPDMHVVCTLEAQTSDPSISLFPGGTCGSLSSSSPHNHQQPASKFPSVLIQRAVQLPRTWHFRLAELPHLQNQAAFCSIHILCALCSLLVYLSVFLSVSLCSLAAPSLTRRVSASFQNCFGFLPFLWGGGSILWCVFLFWATCFMYFWWACLDCLRFSLFWATDSDFASWFGNKNVWRNNIRGKNHKQHHRKNMVCCNDKVSILFVCWDGPPT